MANDKADASDSTRFERALARGLAARPPSAGSCPEPDLVAAYWDGSVSSAERQDLETHVAACATCQAQLAALARTADLEEDQADRSPSGSGRWWLGWRWLVPVTTTAVVVLAVWVTGPTDLPELSAPVSDDQRASAVSAGEAAGADPAGQGVMTPVGDIARRPSESAPAGTPEPVLDRFPDEPGPRAESRARGIRPVDPENAVGPETPSTLLDEIEAPRPAVAARTPALERLAPDAPVPTPDEPAVETGEQRLETRSLASAPAALARADDNRQVGTLATPTAAGTQWRATPNGGVEHSRDGGTTWTVQLVGTGAELASGSSPSPLVCWWVGQAGVIWRTVDGGAAWNRVEPPVTDDLVAVEATSATTAVVATRDGRSFQTDDGGRTWTIQ